MTAFLPTSMHLKAVVGQNRDVLGFFSPSFKQVHSLTTRSRDYKRVSACLLSIFGWDVIIGIWKYEHDLPRIKKIYVFQKIHHRVVR